MPNITLKAPDTNNPKRSGSFAIASGSSPAIQELSRQAYSVGEVMRGDLRADSWERQISNRIASENKNYEVNGCLVPLAVLASKRDLSAQNGNSTGGYLIENEVVDFIVPALRNKSAILGAGAVILPSLSGSNLSIPRVAIPGVAGSGETTDVAIGTIAFEQFKLSANHCHAKLLVSNQLLVQAQDPGIDAYLKDMLLTTVSKLVDKICVSGNGVGQATGLTNMSANTGTNVDPGLLCAPITFGGAASFSKLCQAVYNLDLANFEENNCAWLVSPLTRSKWSQIPMVSTFPEFLFDHKTGKVGAYPSIVSNQLSDTNQAILIKADEAVVGLFGNSIQIASNKYTYATQYVTEITVTILADFNMLRGGAVVSSDTAAT